MAYEGHEAFTINPTSPVVETQITRLALDPQGLNVAGSQLIAITGSSRVALTIYRSGGSTTATISLTVNYGGFASLFDVFTMAGAQTTVHEEYLITGVAVQAFIDVGTTSPADMNTFDIIMHVSAM